MKPPTETRTQGPGMHELPFTDASGIQKAALAKELTQRHVQRKEAHHGRATV
jgi:hypothetical protein